MFIFHIKKMNNILNPRTIALIGATDRAGSVGLSLCKNLLTGSKKRKIFFVNPFNKKVLNKKTYPSVKSIKGVVDLVIIAIPSKVVLGVVKEAVKKKVGGVIIISSGFAELNKDGEILQEKIVKILKEAQIPLLGPNCFGVVVPSINLNTSFAAATPAKGGIAFISQSGALVGSIIDRAFLKHYGFSTIVSYGNGAGLDLCDFLEWLKEDKKTKVIGVYLEAIKEGRRFIRVAKDVGKKKTILVLKAGKTKIGQKTAISHTAALSSSYKTYSAAFKQAGVLEVETIRELFNSSKALSWQPKCKNEIAIVSNSGGCDVLLADYCEEFGVKLAKLDKKLFEKINKDKAMDRNIIPGNPIDIFGDALSNRYEITLNNLLAQKNVHGVMVVQTLQSMTTVEKNAKIIVRIKKKWPDKSIITLFMGGKNVAKGIDILERNKIPNYFDPKEAVLAMKALIR